MRFYEGIIEANRYLSSFQKPYVIITLHNFGKS